MARRGCKRRLELESQYWGLLLSGAGTGLPWRSKRCRLLIIGVRYLKCC
jgi:hypothetical protein